MKLIKKIFITLLYLTPIGYALSLFNLLSGDNTYGICVQSKKNAPITVYVKDKPTALDKLIWIFSGIALLAQSVAALYYLHESKYAVIYAWTAPLFGLLNIITAINPAFEWNKKIKNTRLTIIEAYIILSLIITVLLFVVFFDYLK